MSPEIVLSRLDGVRETGPSRWIAKCPAHDDRHPSLSIRALEGGRTLLHCFAGCEIHSVVSALGLRLSDLFPPRTEENHYGAAEGWPWPAEDVLLAVAHEALIAAIAMNVARGEALSTADRDRALLAAERLRDAVLRATS